MRRHETVQPRGRHLFAHFNQEFRVEAKVPAGFEHGCQGHHVDRMLALVVRDPPPVPAPGPFAHVPGRQAVVPVALHAVDNVAMPVTKHRRECGILDPFGQKEGPSLVVLDPAPKAHGPERRRKCRFQVAVQNRLPFRILAFRRKGDPPCKFTLKGSGFDRTGGQRNDFVATHAAILSHATGFRAPELRIGVAALCARSKRKRARGGALSTIFSAA